MSLTHLGKFLTKVERAKKLCQCLSLREAWKRGYSIQPPDWLGGKSMFDFSGQYDFPEHSKSFDERIKELEAEKQSKKPEKVVRNIGEKQERGKRRRDVEAFREVVLKNKNDKELQRLARLKELVVPLDELRDDWWLESGPEHVTQLARHYGIFRDLFDDNFFHPSLDLGVSYDFDEELVTPVHHGNLLTPSDAHTEPHVSYHASPDSLWCLLMVNPDESLTDQSLEVLHWMVCNIPGDDVRKGHTAVAYMPPLSPSGTGFHRNVFLLLRQETLLKNPPSIPCPSPSEGVSNLQKRLFSTNNFLHLHANLTPTALAFFQAQWDPSVRNYYRQSLGMGEPVFAYDWPTAYHPPPKKYPHKEPFDRYFDRYRDKKDLGEEELRGRLRNTHPFKPQPTPPLSFPLAHKPHHYKPSWLRLKEELMVRKVEQYAEVD